MKPYTTQDAEADLREAIGQGHAETMTRLAAMVDRLATGAPVSLHAGALWYATAGLYVFPIQPGSKVPYAGSQGFKDATTDVQQVDTWWDARPESNIGIATGHLVDVVDIDGPVGQRSRLDAWGMFEQLHVIGTVSTPRPGGMHLYVPATELGNKAGLLPGVDYRGLGGYVVAPPSRTDQGTYRFLAPLTLGEAS